MDYQNPNYLIEWDCDPTGGRLTVTVEEMKKAALESGTQKKTTEF